MVMVCRSKCLSDESIKPPTTTGSILFPRLAYFNNLQFPIKLNGRCLKPDKATFTLKKIINLYVSYEIKLWPF